eukprot:scaffold47756_cov19-Tisochrysis_lutea.AAC.1
MTHNAPSSSAPFDVGTSTGVFMDRHFHASLCNYFALEVTKGKYMQSYTSALSAFIQVLNHSRSTTGKPAWTKQLEASMDKLRAALADKVVKEERQAARDKQ